MKGDIGMANYEKQVEQGAAYPIPTSLYYTDIQKSYYNRRGKFQETGSLRTISYTASSAAGAVDFVMTGSS